MGFIGVEFKAGYDLTALENPGTEDKLEGTVRKLCSERECVGCEFNQVWTPG